MKDKRLLIMAGGTGGHLFPGLAIAHYLKTQGWSIYWLGSADRMEAQWVPCQGIPIDFISIQGVRGCGLRAWLSAPWVVAIAVRQAWRVIRRLQPHVVLGMGGYVSAPGAIAAWLTRRPLVIHEQNTIFGLTNRWLVFIARRILTAFPLPSLRSEVVGNPLRAVFSTMPDPVHRFSAREGPLRLLVVGGSQGARVINAIMPAVAAQLGDRVHIWHQVGQGAEEAVTQAYHALQIVPYRISAFIDAIEEAYCWADLVLCRAGALTISELAAVGLSAILIPFQHVDRQQELNALWLQQLGAADIVLEKTATAERLVDHILRYNRTTLLQRAQLAYKGGRRDAVQQVAAVLEEVAHHSHNAGGNRVRRGSSDGE